MPLAQLFLLVFCTVLVTGVWSNSPPDFSHLPQEERIREFEKVGHQYQNKGYTLEEAVKIRIIMEEIKTFDIETVARICSTLLSSNFTSVEREPTENKSFDILSLFSVIPVLIDEIEEAQLYKNVLCSYVSHPTEDAQHAAALGLSMIPFFKFEHIRKRFNDNQLVAALQLCDAFYSVDNLANLNLKSNPITLNENRIGDLQELWNHVVHLDWDKSPRLVVENLCNSLNVKISSEEQANALEITVDLYSSVVKGLKELSEDNSIENRVNVYRRICRDISLSFGYSELYVSQNGTLTTDEQIKHFSSYTLRVESYGNKWKSIRNVCIYLNETVSIKYIAENAGLSDDQLAQHNSYIPDDEEDEEFLKDNLKSQLLQTMNLCNVIKSDKVTKDHMCKCPPGLEGNPLVECKPSFPCNPSPCGSYSQCSVVNGHAVCAPLQNCIGSPPICRCTANSDCPVTEACFNETCRDPCIDVCGIGANCTVSKHRAVCSCPIGYIGDPLNMCQPTMEQLCIDACGIGAECKVVNERAVCSCPIRYSGNPLVMCQPIMDEPGQCVRNSDCAPNKACVRNKCQNPCKGSCIQNTECQVVNHLPYCSCLAGYDGHPYTECKIQEWPVYKEPSRCMPNPCGSNATCREQNGAVFCQCLPEFFGNPYEACRSECVLNSDCASNKSCIQNKCENPCEDGICAQNAECQTINHAPSCICRMGYTGDPYRLCTIQQTSEYNQSTPCTPNLCGSNAICMEQSGTRSCQCLPEFFGNPYEGCRPECVLNSDCAPNKACIRNKCQNPCEDVCGENAECQIVNHLPSSCKCRLGYVGNPYRLCTIPKDDEYVIPCSPSLCGANSFCYESNDQAVCSCLQNYTGSPPSCRPECVVGSECSFDKPCTSETCGTNDHDPCSGFCGISAECIVIKHTPTYYYSAGVEHQMEEFIYKASKIFSSPLADRLELLRGVCKTNFRLSTIPRLN